MTSAIRPESMGWCCADSFSIGRVLTRCFEMPKALRPGIELDIHARGSDDVSGITLVSMKPQCKISAPGPRRQL